jgi:hypothetical protein
LLGLLVVASLILTSVADVPRGTGPADAAPAVEERPSKPEFAPDRSQDEPKIVRVTAPERTRSAPVPPAVIPGTAMIAYEAAASAVDCGLHWSVLAAIGRVESNHGRFGGTNVMGDGTVAPAIRGIQLDGRAGVATIHDTDGGRLDGDLEYDRAIGPMQFIPTTWQKYAADGNGDGLADPDNIYDAALVAARYLCADGADLRVPEQLSAAVFRYNRSQTYVDMVLLLAEHYRNARLIAEPVMGDLPRPARPVVGTPAAPPPPAPTPAETASVSATPPPAPTPTPSVCPSTEDAAPSAPPTDAATPEPLLPLPLVAGIIEGLVGSASTPASTTSTTPSTAPSTTSPSADC